MSPQKTEAPIDHRLIRALGHPTRQRILQALSERVASPNMLASELDEPLGTVSYHVKILAECDAVELVRTHPVRGALEHFYRATARPRIEDAEHWAKLPVATRRALFDQTLQQIWDHVIEAGEKDGFDNPNTHIGWTNLDLDQQAYQEVTDLLIATLDRALELQAESLARRAELPEEEREGHRTELAMMHFHRQPGRGKRSGKRSGRQRRSRRAKASR